LLLSELGQIEKSYKLLEQILQSNWAPIPTLIDATFIDKAPVLNKNIDLDELLVIVRNYSESNLNIKLEIGNNKQILQIKLSVDDEGSFLQKVDADFKKALATMNVDVRFTKKTGMCCSSLDGQFTFSLEKLLTSNKIEHTEKLGMEDMTV
jgi:hypothetical protein